jgi:hypothetical protein
MNSAMPVTATVHQARDAVGEVIGPFSSVVVCECLLIPWP